MIQFETTRFGSLEVEQDRLVNFPEGLIGLPELKKFILIDHKDTPLKWLQSVDDPDMAFIVGSPSLLVAEYSLQLEDAVRKYLQLDNEEDLVPLVIMRVQGEDVIANFQGPILINAENMRGVQLVVEGKPRASQKAG
jgi:flagellar assembly factor FliW